MLVNLKWIKNAQGPDASEIVGTVFLSGKLYVYNFANNQQEIMDFAALLDKYFENLDQSTSHLEDNSHDFISENEENPIDQAGQKAHNFFMKILELQSTDQGKRIIEDNNLFITPLVSLTEDTIKEIAQLVKQKEKRYKRQPVNLTDRIYLSLFNESAMQRIRRNLRDSKGFLPDDREGHFSKQDGNVTLTISNGLELLDLFAKRQQGKMHEVMEDVANKVNSLDETTADVYKILTSKWILERFKEGKDKGKAFISLEDIHFNYRRKSGKNKNSTLTPEQKINYEQALSVLSRMKVLIDITKEKGRMYDEIRRHKGAFIESPIFRYNWARDEDGNIVGFLYDFDELGKTYTEFLKLYNNRYPKKAIELDNRYYAPAKRIIDEITHWHRNNEYRKKENFVVQFSKLLEIADYDIKNKREKKKTLERFITRQLNEVEQVLKGAELIEKMIIPNDINTKNYLHEKTKVTIIWNLSSYEKLSG